MSSLICFGVATAIQEKRETSDFICYLSENAGGFVNPYADSNQLGQHKLEQVTSFIIVNSIQIWGIMKLQGNRER